MLYYRVYLQHFAEINALHQIIDILVVEIMGEYQQSALDVAGLRQADD